jgi:TonB family protein
MRHIFAASLLFSPLFFTAAAVASTPATDATVPTATRTVSTGITPAKVLHSADVEFNDTSAIPNYAEVVLKLDVDKEGQARDIQVVKSINPALDEPVIQAVRKFRFAPAKLDNQAVDLPMDLTIVVQH